MVQYSTYLIYSNMTSFFCFANKWAIYLDDKSHQHMCSAHIYLDDKISSAHVQCTHLSQFVLCWGYLFQWTMLFQRVYLLYFFITLSMCNTDKTIHTIHKPTPICAFPTTVLWLCLIFHFMFLLVFLIVFVFQFHKWIENIIFY